MTYFFVIKKKKSWQKNVLKYVCDTILTTKLFKLILWHLTSDITPDTLHMGVGEHGVNFHVYSCYGLRVKVF